MLTQSFRTVYFKYIIYVKYQMNNSFSTTYSHVKDIVWFVSENDASQLQILLLLQIPDYKRFPR